MGVVGFEEGLSDLTFDAADGVTAISGYCNPVKVVRTAALVVSMPTLNVPCIVAVSVAFSATVLTCSTTFLNVFIGGKKMKTSGFGRDGSVMPRMKEDGSTMTGTS